MCLLDRGLQVVPSLQESLRGEAARLQRDYVTHSTPALLAFRLLIVMCSAGLVGANACFAIYGSSVALLHSQMDEVVFAYRPMADQLVRPQRVLLEKTGAYVKQPHFENCAWRSQLFTVAGSIFSFFPPQG